MNIILTGANGFVGRNLYHALRNDHKLVLLDYKKGKDASNRFGLEGVEISLAIPEHEIIELDLTKEAARFEEILAHFGPNCMVIHCAGVLESQDPEAITEKNRAMHQTILKACTQSKTTLIAMSSVMVMYGNAMASPKIRASLEKTIKEPFLEEERIKMSTPLLINPDLIKMFNPEQSTNNLAYIKSKVELEAIAKEAISSDPSLTIVMIRLGWTGAKNPYLIEAENKPKYSETTVYLDPAEDLASFFKALIIALEAKRVSGYKCYCPVSEHSQRWISLEDIKVDLSWSPTTDIETKYARTASTAMIFGKAEDKNKAPVTGAFL